MCPSINGRLPITVSRSHSGNFRCWMRPRGPRTDPPRVLPQCRAVALAAAKSLLPTSPFSTLGKLGPASDPSRLTPARCARAPSHHSGEQQDPHPRPTSELRDGKNVFVAEVVLHQPDPRLRPGMTGTVRINCDSSPLFWNLFHRPWDWAASRLTWW